MVVIYTKFHKFYGRSFARVLLRIFYPYERYWSVTPLDACYKGQQDDFP